MAFSPDLIDRVREASDIVGVVGEHVQLKRAGRTWKALCPFHREKTPSFIVNPDRQIFKCFGCGVGGDVFRFVQDAEKLSFPEAMELLAERAGIPLPKQRWDKPEDESVYPVLAWAASEFQRHLNAPGGTKARAYLEGRALTEPITRRFGLGWAPEGWSTLLDAAGRRYSPQILERAGLVSPREGGGFYDRFRGRVVIPIRSALGKTVGFGARIIGEGEPKYLNSPETEVFHKGKILFGLYEAREALKDEGVALVVEGYMDVLALVQAGFQHAVAACGTAFTADQARVLKRYVDKVVLLFDGDEAGIRAAWKSAGVFLDEGLEVRVAVLPEGHDPDSFVGARGRDAMREALDTAPTVVQFAKQALLGKLERREDLVRAFAYLAARIEDPIRRRVLLQEASEEFRFDEQVLAAEARRLRKGETAAATRRSQPAKPVRPSVRDVVGRRYVARVLCGEADADPDLEVTESVIQEPGLRDILRRHKELLEEGDPRPRDRILAEDATRSLAAEVLAEDTDAGDPIQDVVVRLRERERDAEGRKIWDAIRRAETAGNRDEVERLQRELMALRGHGPG